MYIDCSECKLPLFANAIFERISEYRFKVRCHLCGTEAIISLLKERQEEMGIDQQKIFASPIPALLTKDEKLFSPEESWKYILRISTGYKNQDIEGIFLPTRLFLENDEKTLILEGTLQNPYADKKEYLNRFISIFENEPLVEYILSLLEMYGITLRKREDRNYRTYIKNKGSLSEHQQRFHVGLYWESA
jgi:hypothetical protein